MRQQEEKTTQVMVDEFSVMIDELKKVQQVDRAMRTACNSVLAAQKQRIFSQGNDAAGTQIGTYSTNPISISRRAQAKQTGKTYFKGGYAEYKSLIGRNPGRVILRNTDQMMMDYGVHVLDANQYGLGFSNDLNGDKSGWMEEKYGKEIFAEHPAEGELMETVLFAELNRVMP